MTKTTLRFSPTAWLKLLWFCHRGDTEVGGYAVTRPSDPLYVEEFHAPAQECSCITVEFDDDAVAGFCDRMTDRGLKPKDFARVWVHTHPGSSPDPSYTDEQTFDRVFGPCDWAVMFILARGGATYARLRANGFSFEVPVAVDWSSWPETAGQVDPQAWLEEYEASVRVVPLAPAAKSKVWEPLSWPEDTKANSNQVSLPRESEDYFRREMETDLAGDYSPQALADLPYDELEELWESWVDERYSLNLEGDHGFNGK